MNILCVNVKTFPQLLTFIWELGSEIMKELIIITYFGHEFIKQIIIRDDNVWELSIIIWLEWLLFELGDDFLELCLLCGYLSLNRIERLGNSFTKSW